MKEIIKAIGATLKAFLIWCYIVLVGLAFTLVPLGALVLGTWLIIKIFTF